MFLFLSLGEHGCAFPPGTHLAMGSRGHGVCELSVLAGSAKQFSKAVAPVSVPTGSQKVGKIRLTKKKKEKKKNSKVPSGNKYILKTALSTESAPPGSLNISAAFSEGKLRVRCVGLERKEPRKRFVPTSRKDCFPR